MITISAAGATQYTGFGSTNLLVCVRLFGYQQNWADSTSSLPVGICSTRSTRELHDRRLQARDPDHPLVRDFAALRQVFPLSRRRPLMRASSSLPQLRKRRGRCDLRPRQLLIFLRGLVRRALVADGVRCCRRDLQEIDAGSSAVHLAWRRFLLLVQILLTTFSGYSTWPSPSPGCWGTS